MLLVVMAYLVLLAINFRDQEPSPAVLALKKITLSRERPPQGQNGYIFLLGFSSGKTEDPHMLGNKYVQWAMEILQQPTNDARDFPDINADLKSEKTPFVEQILEQCKTLDAACLFLLEQNKSSIGDWVAMNGWLLDRYKTLIGHTVWYEELPFDVRLPIPYYNHVFDAQILLFAQAWLAAVEDDPGTVDALLEQDIRFWREVLRSSDLLITKMIATAAINRHFNWSAAILQALPAERIKSAIPESWRDPISREERSMLRCMAGEWVFYNSILQQMKSGEYASNEYETFYWLDAPLWFFVNPMLKRQDSSNLYAERVLAMEEALDEDYENYPQAVQDAASLWQFTWAPTFLGRAYNVVGNMMLASEEWAPTLYAVRVADLEGVRRLALLTVQLSSASIPVAEMSQALQKAELKDPYYGEPFAWDALNTSLIFHGLEENERGRHVIFYQGE